MCFTAFINKILTSLQFYYFNMRSKILLSKFKSTDNFNISISKAYVFISKDVLLSLMRSKKWILASQIFRTGRSFLCHSIWPSVEIMNYLWIVPGQWEPRCSLNTFHDRESYYFRRSSVKFQRVLVGCF